MAWFICKKQFVEKCSRLIHSNKLLRYLQKVLKQRRWYWEFHMFHYILALSSRSLKTSGCVGSSPAASSGLFFSNQLDDWICCLRAPMRESRLSEVDEGWQLKTTVSSSANNKLSASVLFPSQCSFVAVLEASIVLSLALPLSFLPSASVVLCVCLWLSCLSFFVLSLSGRMLEPWSSSKASLILSRPGGEKQNSINSYVRELNINLCREVQAELQSYKS